MDDSDYEPTEDAHDELDYVQSDKPAKPAGGYHLTNVLPLPRATTYSTQALYDQIYAGDINLEPEYQRDVVWPESKQIGLVDSILRNFYVPPVIFVTHQHEDGSEAKTCIDGKQRLTSLHRFMDGQIPHRDPSTGKKYWYKVNAESRQGQLLPEGYRRLFANKQVVCIEYQDLSDSNEREIFQRVQLGMALTPAEKLQVLNTPMSAFVRRLQSEYLGTESPLDSKSFEWDRSRGGDFRCITQALYVIAKYPSAFSIGTIVQLEKWLHKPTTKLYARGRGKKMDDDSGEDLSSDELFLERIHGTFRTFSSLVSDDSDPPLQLHFLKPEWRVSPIEFVMMCLLISVKKDSMTLDQLAMTLGDMRARVRQEHRDIRMNTRVAKTLFDFIKECPDGPLVPEPVMNGLKRKREEEEVVLYERKEKERKENEDSSIPALSQVSPVHSPPRLALREVRKTIAPPRVTPPGMPTTPAASR